MAYCQLVLVIIISHSDSSKCGHHYTSRLSEKRSICCFSKKTYSLCSEIGITVLFGIPNKYSFNGFINHLDWSHNGNFIEHTKKIKTLPISYFVSRFNGSKWPYSIMLKLWVKIFASYNQNDWGEKETQNLFIYRKRSLINLTKALLYILK